MQVANHHIVSVLCRDNDKPGLGMTAPHASSVVWKKTDDSVGDDRWKISSVIMNLMDSIPSEMRESVRRGSLELRVSVGVFGANSMGSVIEISQECTQKIADAGGHIWFDFYPESSDD